MFVCIRSTALLEKGVSDVSSYQTESKMYKYRVRVCCWIELHSFEFSENSQIESNPLVWSLLFVCLGIVVVDVVVVCEMYSCVSLLC